LPFITVDDVRLFYRLEGASNKPTLVLSHSLGVDHNLWDVQVADLLPHFRILRYDTRGHGASDGPPGDYSIERLANDVLGLADALGIRAFAFCGISLRGFIGQWLAARAQGRVSHLILANTSSNVGPASNWEARRQAVQKGGMSAVSEMFLQRSFVPETLARAEPRVESLQRTFLGTNPVGYTGCCAAVRDMNQTAMLREIRVPTLVISGDRDVATPWEGHGEVLAREIHGARALRLPAAHLSNIERPRSFTAALFDFLLPPAPENARAAGEKIRRAVLGDTHVDSAIAKTTDFTRDFQDLITRYAWGTIWTRPGLDPRQRRLLALVAMAALGRWDEFRFHVRTGLAHELESCDLKEALLQLAIYAGVPAANTAFQIAKEEESNRRTPV
jgi:3-oxoadipate enol-lactonase/4-carboxymuconolactone decarboxylase